MRIAKNRLDYGFKNLVKFNFIQRFKFINIYTEIPYLSKITIIMRSHNWSYDMNDFKKSFFFLRLFFSKKPIFKIINRKRKNPLKVYNPSAFFKFNIRKIAMLEIFEYLTFFLFRFKKKYIKVFDIFDNKGNHIFIVRDLTVFFRLGEAFFQWPYPLIFNFVFKKSDVFMSSLYLRTHGFSFLN